jgi:hypothetical protein
MDDARRSAEWDHTASLMALIANCHRDPKRSPIVPADFHPFAPKPQPVKVPLSFLRGLLFGHDGSPADAAVAEPTKEPPPP